MTKLVSEAMHRVGRYDPMGAAEVLPQPFRFGGADGAEPVLAAEGDGAAARVVLIAFGLRDSLFARRCPSGISFSLATPPGVMTVYKTRRDASAFD